MRRFAVCCLLALAVLILASAARADLIFFKDGYALQGKVHREGTTEYDKTSQEFTFMPKGFFFVDDGPRRVYFTPTQVAIVERLSPPNEERVVRTEIHVVFAARPPLMEDVNEIKPWDYKAWTRPFSYRSPTGSSVSCTQKIAEMTPYFARVDAITKFKWSSGYLTRELDAETVHKLLLNHPHLQDDYMPPRPVKKVPRPKIIDKDAEKDKKKDDKDKDDKDKKKDDKDKKKDDKKVKEPEWPDKPTPGMIVARRMRLCDFFAQAGWFDVADKELDRLIKDFPDQKRRVEEARKMVARLRAREEWEQIKNWYHGARYEAVRKRIDKFPVGHAPDRVLADLREMKSKITQSDEMLAESKKALDACAKDVKTAKGRSLASVVPLIKKELHATTVERLDAFLSQYRDAERQKQRQKSPNYTPDELLALAVSGWLLGSPSAEPRPDPAISLWKTRQLVLEYCQESNAGARQKILARYEKEVAPRVDFDEVAQLIESLPPVDPGKITDELTEVTVGKGKNAATYHLKLPPEYSHGRTYPVLIVLPNAGEKATTALKRWEKAAADHGYVLAAVDWDTGFKNRHNFGERDQDCVLDTLRDLRRRYQIDSDRVFLFGHAEGAKMAFDVGLSHPDLFAGVIPMNGGVYLYPRRYWRNAQYLPFYVINGTQSPGHETIRDQMTDWTQRGYPALWVEYKGRGGEFLGGEVPNVFDWMRNQRRAFPLRQLGTGDGSSNFGNEFCTLRVEDNRFYWLSTTDINARCIVPSDKWTITKDPARMTASINPETNEVFIKQRGLGQVTIWLGRSPKGQMMLDLEKTVQVRVGLASAFNKKVTPSLSVMLEDLVARGDRKHLYLAKIEVNLRK
jgi:pimeloyl-ACP methyl ester carboxylesterase